MGSSTLLIIRRQSDDTENIVLFFVELVEKEINEVKIKQNRNKNG